MGKVNIGRMVLGLVETNCYYIYDDEKMEAVVIDPAENGVYDALTAKGLKIVAVILTHGHFDHIMGVHELLEKSGARLYAYKKEEELCKSAKLNASEQIRRPCTVEPDVYLEDGQEFVLAGINFKAIATPGHTAGSCCYYIPKEDWLLSGDTLFRGSIGRSDLPTGNEREILKSVNMLLDCADFTEETKVYPGHGEASTIGFERQYNPFRN